MRGREIEETLSNSAEKIPFLMAPLLLMLKEITLRGPAVELLR